MPTPNLNLPTIDSSMTADVPRDVNALANAVDSAVGKMSTVPTTSKEVAGAITELFQSGVNGKNQLEAAVIAKEGTVSKQGDTATFDELDTGIRSIPVGPDTTDATAVAGDLRAGKTAYVNGAKVTGNVPVQAGGNVVPAQNDIVKPAGIYDTPVTVKGVVVPVANVLEGTNIAGQAGTMKNRANTKFQIAGYEEITEIIPHPAAPANQGLITARNAYAANGYIDANSQIQFAVMNLLPEHIRQGVPIGRYQGVGSQVMVGTLAPGKRVVKGSLSTLYDNASQFTNKDGSIVTARRYVQITGHGFVPGTIVITSWFSASNDIGYYYAVYRDVKFDGTAAANNYWESTDQKIGWKPNVGACVVNADMIRLPYLDPNTNVQANYVIIEA